MTADAIFIDVQNVQIMLVQREDYVTMSFFLYTSRGDSEWMGMTRRDTMERAQRAARAFAADILADHTTFIYMGD